MFDHAPPAFDYAGRIRQFQENLAAAADLAFLPISADLHYLAGVERDTPNYGAVLHPGAWLEGLWLTPQAKPVFTLSRMTAEYEFAKSGGTDTFETRILGDWDDPAALVRDVLDGFSLPERPRVALSHKTEGRTIIALQRLLPEARFLSATDLLFRQRVIKSEAEIEMLRRAGSLTERAFTETVNKLQHGMREIEVVMELEYQLRQRGGFGPSFTTSLYCAGPTRQTFFRDRRVSWELTLAPPVALLFDFGVILDGFCYDYGRTVVFGEPDEQAREVHRLVMASQAAGIAALRAGEVTCEQTDAAARSVIEEGGFGEAFRHRLGHAIGMDVHEPPFLTEGDDTLLQEGMCFTIEPSIMLTGELSARVEDIVVARPGGGEKLTDGYQELIVI
ncbi:MAG: M24 family metallopeptidase [Chloroflexi bacterium]|nr:M24 family metallopeptidase [Chloroflexota bacterium]